MNVHGCQIVSQLAAECVEGFSSLVSRGEETRGPFPTIAEAVMCAKGWSEESNLSDSLRTSMDVGPKTVLTTPPNITRPLIDPQPEAIIAPAIKENPVP